jgi:hypothetical protein
MHKKFTKTAAFIALFAILFLFAPGISNAKEKPFKIDLRAFVKKPAVWISSFWGIFDPIFHPGKDAPKVIAPGDSVTKIKPLTDATSLKPSKGD